MKKIMIIGAVGAGKTSLANALHGEGEKLAKKTQSLEYKAFTIDTPGEYMENPRLYRNLMSTALEAKTVLFVQDSTKHNSIFPPGFARAFSCMTLGIVTKIDQPEANTENALNFLLRLGLKGRIFNISAISGEGIEELKRFLDL